ncbi:hypothetical protein B0I37DRAFT_438955 [Chaetomium sp. MPI-CAGE-AT-0009]|nr:hypothetical protein B0I37DRAFT_438955 [Chaetomium sp. MPI-CAGE-AT-0009]
MHAIVFLAQHLNIESRWAAAVIINCFTEYVSDFLLYHPDVLDPDFAQIRARVHLTMAHRPVGWLWTQETASAKQFWGQEEHATSFVLHVLDYLYNSGYIPKDCTIDSAVSQIHQRLCMLQSLCLGNGVWIEDSRLQDDLRMALLGEMSSTIAFRPSVSQQQGNALQI